MSNIIDEEGPYGWRRSWEWPWKNKKRTAKKALIGLGQMHDRLMRRRVWVYQGPEKYKPVLRIKRIISKEKESND